MTFHDVLWHPRRFLLTSGTHAGNYFAATGRLIQGATISAGSSHGSGSSQVLASPSQGLGIATLDARISLLIPVTADSGSYLASLTLTAVQGSEPWA